MDDLVLALMLAMYDLCAVLTLCGPLKAFVNLMSQEDSPEIPGLLYEAEFQHDEEQRPGVSRALSDMVLTPPKYFHPGRACDTDH